jgi:hypothetical protein
VDRELTAFLVQLSIALHKSAAYPSRHPLAVGAVEAALAGLAERLRERPSLTLGIARTHWRSGSIGGRSAASSSPAGSMRRS